jgi:hypothetical protein
MPHPNANALEHFRLQPYVWLLSVDAKLRNETGAAWQWC